MGLNSKGLGRGLDALFHVNQPGGDAGGEEAPFALVPPDALVPNPNQPRTSFSEESLGELAESMRKQGILQPLLARPAEPGKYQIIAGERRWRAAKLAGIGELPVIVRNLDDSEALIVALMENIQREDLNPIDQAKGLLALKEALGITQDELADRLGKPHGSVSNCIRLLRLDEASQQDLIAGRISAGHARCLLTLPPGADVEELRKRIIETGMTVRDTEYALKIWHEESRFPWQKEEGEGAPESGEDGGKRAKPARMRDPDIERIAKEIGSTLNCRTKINGNADKGRISIAYDSNEQFYEILEKFGMTMDSFAKMP